MTNIELAEARHPALARGADPRRWWALAVLCLSLILITLDNTVLNVALPTLVRDLHASTSQLQWIVDSYQLVFAGLLFSAGSMADRYGRKGTLALGLAVFGMGTLAAAFADSAGMLIVTRAFMGIGGALITPSTLSILGDVFPDPAERSRAIAIWAAMAAVGIALGPVLGGLLLAHFGWGSIFLVNVPVVVAALIGGGMLLPKSRDPAPGRMDLLGSVLSIATLMTIVFAVIEGPGKGWTSSTVLGAAGAGIALLAAFLAWESHCDHPMLDLALFRDRRFTGGAVTLTLLYFSALGTYFLYTQHLQFVLGYSALRAGIYTVPFAVVLVVFSLQTPKAVRWFGTGRVAGAGLLLLTLGTLVRSGADAHTGYGVLLVSLVIVAAGVCSTIAPSTTSIMSSLPPHPAGKGRPQPCGGGEGSLRPRLERRQHRRRPGRDRRGLPGDALPAVQGPLECADEPRPRGRALRGAVGRARGLLRLRPARRRRIRPRSLRGRARRDHEGGPVAPAGGVPSRAGRRPPGDSRDGVRGHRGARLARGRRVGARGAPGRRRLPGPPRAVRRGRDGAGPAGHGRDPLCWLRRPRVRARHGQGEDEADVPRPRPADRRLRGHPGARMAGGRPPCPSGGRVHRLPVVRQAGQPRFLRGGVQMRGHTVSDRRHRGGAAPRPEGAGRGRPPRAGDRSRRPRQRPPGRLGAGRGDPRS